MNKNLSRMLLAVLALCFLGLFACGKEAGSSSMPEPVWKGADMEPGSSQLQSLEHVVRSSTHTTGETLAAGITIVGILLIPWLVIGFVPGFLVGKYERIVEASIMLAFTILDWHWAWRFGVWYWLLACVTVPAVILLLKESEEGKITLFLIPGLCFLGFVAWRISDWLREGLVSSSIIYVGGVGGVILVILGLLLLRRDNAEKG